MITCDLCSRESKIFLLIQQLDYTTETVPIFTEVFCGECFSPALRLTYLNSIYYKVTEISKDKYLKYMILK